MEPVTPEQLRNLQEFLAEIDLPLEARTAGRAADRIEELEKTLAENR